MDSAAKPIARLRVRPQPPPPPADALPPRPALDIHLPATPASLAPRLDALLDDHHPFAIQDARDRDTAAPDAVRGLAPLARRVYFFSATARDAARRAIDRTLGPDGARATPIDVCDDGWAARAQASLRAVRVGDIVVSPPWDMPPPNAALGNVVVIEPSMGFGTGHHASTRLCLQALQRFRHRVRASRRVLDLGAGSGVLAIAAALLGAGSVIAVERDPDALENARDNVRRNRVGGRVAVLDGDIADLGPDAGDVVTANLTGAFFVGHAARVLRCVRNGGLLLASGIAAAEEQPVRAALKPLSVLHRAAEDEWVGLAFERCERRAAPRA